MSAKGHVYLTEASNILAECSKYFHRCVAIEESLLGNAIPFYQYISGYLFDVGVLKKSVELQFLFQTREMSNFFDYFEAYTFLLFEQTVPPRLAKEIASELTLLLIRVWEVSDDPKAYQKLMESNYYIRGIKLELQNCRGQVGTQVGEILATICQQSVIELDPSKKGSYQNSVNCHIEF